MTDTDNITITRLSLRLPVDISIRLSILKEETKRTRNDLIIEAIKEFLDRKDKQPNILDELEQLKREIDDLKIARS